ncbi:MAG: tetratricopeptide repeat protein [Planctomycetota bacterium]
MLLLAVLLAAAAVHRLLYHLAQPAADPFAFRPFLDGEAYVDGAQAILAGTAERGEAFYLAPLYPYLLAGLFAATGVGLGAVYLVQHVLSLATAAGVGWLARRRAGDTAGIAAAALFAFHSPLVFFAATPMGETVALFLLVASLVAAEGRSGPRAAGAGLLAGLASLARPNLLLVPLFLALGDLAARRWRRAGWLAAGAALAVLPVTVRNLAASGHPVAISANGGLTLYHGNGPGATGVFTRPEGFSGLVARQREEATVLARARSGERGLDAVEADRWWGEEARRVRLADPAGTLSLLGWRALLLLDDFEHALDYDPTLDGNPWRARLRWGVDPARPGSGREVALVPFALLLALAAAALAARGPRGSGGWALWGPILACAATPIVFYVSSRYRLATSALLAIPGGIGLATLAGRAGALSAGRRRIGLAAALAAAALSFAVPSGALARQGRAFGLSNRGGILTLAGDWAAAERYARAAVAAMPELSIAHHNLASLLARTGREEEAIAAYREAIARDPTNADSVAALAQLLLPRGRGAELEGALRRAVQARPSHAPAWTALVHVLARQGRRAEAEDAARAAASHGLRIDPRAFDPGGR